MLWVVQKGVCIDGYNIVKTQVNNTEECQQKCLSYSACKSYDIKGLDTDLPYCYLNSKDQYDISLTLGSVIYTYVEKCDGKFYIGECWKLCILHDSVFKRC